MTNSVTAVVIAALGLLSTLAAAIASQLLSARARRDDLLIQRSQRQEEVEFASKKSCYAEMMISSRRYRVELMTYLDMVKQGSANSAARADLENERRACLASLGEVELVATRKVLSAIEPINSRLTEAYDGIRHFEAGESLSDDSLAKIHRSLEELLEQWRQMADMMRQDLGAKD